MLEKQTFYDRYHLQNDYFAKQLGMNNFTYFYIFQTFREACLQGQWQHKKVLDVGCGVGTLSLWCAGQGAEVTGIDVSPRAIRIARKAQKALKLPNVTFIEGELKSGRATYDVVICSEVIEHVPDPHLVAKQMFSHLKPGGILILGTPSSQNWLYKIGYYKQFDARVGHLRRYTKSEITKQLTEVGFTILSLRPVEGPLRNILFTSPLGFLIKAIKGPLVPLFHVFDRWSASLFGAADFQVIAQKPSQKNRSNSTGVVRRKK